MEIKKINLKVKFEEIEEFQHPQFTKVKVWVATYGENANGSNITKEAFESAMKSLYNVPILGEWSESIEDFKGHGGKLEITDEGINYIETTKPYGVIPESCNPRWEFDNENIEYLVCDGLIWTGRYEESKKVMENCNNQSMEIELIDYSIENNITVIKDFAFTGICILGESTQPCFPSAKIVYSLNKDEYKKEFNLMLEEIKNINFKEGGDNQVDERKQIINKFSHLKGKEFDDIVSNKDLTLEELKDKLFSLSVNDLERRIREELKTNTVVHTDWWGDTYECQKYYLEDVIPDENIAICEDCDSWYKFYGIPYSVNGDKIELNYDNVNRYIRGDWRVYEEGYSDITSNIFEVELKHNKEKIESIKADFETTNEKLINIKADFSDLQTNYSTIEAEVNELREYRSNVEKAEFEAKEQARKTNIDELVDKYSELKSIEGFDKLIENKYEKSIEDLEVSLKVFAFDNNVVLGKKTKKNFSKETGSKIPVISTNKEIKQDSAWDLLEKYIPNNK